MREADEMIKFRAWFDPEVVSNSDEPDPWEVPRMIYNVQNLYDGRGTDDDSGLLAGHGCFGHLLRDPRFTIMQYTGFLDVKDREIYEGDLFDNIQAPVNWVHWYRGQWCYGNYHATALPLDDDTPKEIIGNVYENPGLV